MKMTTNYKGFKIIRHAGTPGYIVRSAKHVAKGFPTLADAVSYIEGEA